MRIISKYKDYYDSAQAFGSESFVYMRDPQEKWLEVSDLKEGIKFGIFSLVDKKVRISPRITVFCGKFYPSLEVEYESQAASAENRWMSKKEFIFFYGFDEADKGIRKILEKNDKALESYTKKEKSRRYYFRTNINRDYIKRFFERKDFGVSADALHHKFQSPVITYGSSSLLTWYFGTDHTEKNIRVIKPDEFSFDRGSAPRNATVLRCIDPILMPFNFQKVMPPFEANQELSMYIGGVLSNVENNMVQIDDESMKQAKGFDKWSFKTMPSKRKKK